MNNAIYMTYPQLKWPTQKPGDADLYRDTLRRWHYAKQQRPWDTELPPDGTREPFSLTQEQAGEIEREVGRDFNRSV
jgi:hypothetical protein